MNLDFAFFFNSALLGLGLSAASLLIFGADDFLLPAMAAIMVCLAIFQRIIERRGGADA